MFRRSACLVINMSLLLSIFFFFCSVNCSAIPARASSNQQSQPQQVTAAPKFMSRGQTYRAVIGDTLVLPCEVQDLGSYVLLWRRGSAVVTADKMMVTRDPRFRLVDGYNLEIGNVMPQDAGDYVCQIGEYRDQINTVEILVPPSVRTSPASGQLTARKGGTVTLECKASGNPVPTILWSRKDDSLPSGEKALEGFSITLEKVDRHQAGVYQCTASNGVGEPITVDMQLHVLYPPEVEVERSWVHSGEGYEAQLVCIVHGEPHPNTLWYQDSFPLEPTERRTMESRGNKHTLTIRNVQSSDFGNYSCVAENTLGKAKKYMELSGRPSPAQFNSLPYSRSRDSYNLTWQLESYPPLEEVRLLYRKLMINETPHHPGNWHDVILKPSNGETFSHVMSYDIRNLESGSVYEAIVQAKNRYGWNEVSESMQFYTRGPSEDTYDYPSEPHVDMELVAASSSKLMWQPSLLLTLAAVFRVVS
ncbi:limbic system-associated membrane protein isoform X1 [Nilaparvata lugens]|uniref:limbic system-associated membrane protein isoform X1 n=2 Tax=Nilaparvata lugens TaxID=108931 RepID=UPI00193E7BBC|nr:limbic system-associated membrane protein isoform X1 [Nilaparvata lugens]